MNEELRELEKKGLLRKLVCARQDGAFVEIGGKRFLNFSSNDYLGISARLDLQKKFLGALEGESGFLFGSSASRLITGNSNAYEQLEEKLARAYGKPTSLVFNSGYHANTGILTALADKDDLVLADRLVHASIIDALRLGEAKFLRFAHNDTGNLERLLSANRAKFKNVFIVTESVFSMDGDRAPLAEIVRLKNAFAAKLYVDEAHAVGVFGHSGLGLAEAEGLVGEIDFLMGTFGKALASEGAFVVCDEDSKSLLVNKSRPFIFTTAMPPVNVLWTGFVFDEMRVMSAERARLQSLRGRFGQKVSGLIGGSQIAPLVIGENDMAMEFSKKLAEEKIWAACVRHPTVPMGGARVRFSLSAAMAEDDIDACAAAVSKALEAYR